jgi:hypothetical protein
MGRSTLLLVVEQIEVGGRLTNTLGEKHAPEMSLLIRIFRIV